MLDKEINVVRFTCLRFARQVLSPWEHPSLRIIFIREKNEGICIDDDARDRASCECVSPFAGETCEINLCDGIECKNGGTCAVEVIDEIRTPTCKCPDNTEGEQCNCQPGYASVGNICEETCALSPCKEMIQNFLRASPIKIRFDPASQDR